MLGGASLAASVAAPLGPFAERAVAAEELTQEYRDAVDLYSFKVPAGWEKALGDTSPDPRSSRAVVAFYPPGDPDVNVNVVATALGDTTHAFIAGTNYSFGANGTYPATYGVDCGAHDLSLPPYCGPQWCGADKVVVDWCANAWCWVDVNACDGVAALRARDLFLPT